MQANPAFSHLQTAEVAATKEDDDKQSQDEWDNGSEELQEQLVTCDPGTAAASKVLGPVPLAVKAALSTLVCTICGLLAAKVQGHTYAHALHHA